MKEGMNPSIIALHHITSYFVYANYAIQTLKAVTTGVFWVFEHPPPKFQGKIRHTKTDLLLATKFSKVTSSIC